jgi:hypothetical protein
MKSGLRIILGSHNHIPYGAGDEEGEHIYAARLKPFIQTLNQFPKIPAALHYSGALLTWLEANHPELINILEDLISRKQVEILGGGFYEPMMPLLPYNDKVGQIELLTAYLRKKFGKRPQGCWIPQAAWEQQLVGVLDACGMSYTFLEERYFAAAGFSGSGPRAPCISENQGKIAVVFPLSEQLQTAFATRDASQVLDRLIQDTLSQDAASQDTLITVFPDRLFAGEEGESAEARYGRFFESLSNVSGAVEFTTPAKYHKNLGHLHKAYFPGDAGRNFLIDYPEANDLYAKMLFTHVLINQLRGDKARKQNAREELWKAQGYTLFTSAASPPGGNYADIRRAPLRKAVYKALLGAERICRDQGKFTPSLLAFDFDFDGKTEYLFQDRNINCYVTSAGASVFELDYLPKTWNYLDTFSGDRFRRTAFADQLSLPAYSFRDAREFRLEGVRFCGRENFKLLDMDRSHGRAEFMLPAQDAVGASYLDRIEIGKRYLLKQDTLQVRYTLINRGPTPASFKFAPRIDLSFSGGGEDLLKVFRLRSQEHEPAIGEGIEIRNVRGLEFRDLKNELTLSLLAEQNFDAWLLPIRDSLTAQYQSTCLMPVMTLTLASAGQWNTEFKLNISH